MDSVRGSARFANRRDVLLTQWLTIRRATVYAGVSASALLLACALARADGWEAQAVASAPFSWTGLYIGLHTGAASATTQVSDPFGSSIYGDTVRSSGGLLGGQVGANVQMGAVVLGIDADVSAAEIDGSRTCFAYSGIFISADCRARTDVLGTLTGRLGVATGSEGRTLLYAKGGAAWEHRTVDATTNGDLGLGAASSSTWRLGWTAGGGIEQALAGNWSLKAEYDYLAFGTAKVATPVPPNVANASQDMHQFKIGLDYRLGGDVAAVVSPDYGARDTGRWSGWTFEMGARYWATTSRFQKDIDAPSLISRITFDGVRDGSGELFARLDTPSKVFVKGLVGIGTTQSGRMNDEDWGIPADPAGGILAFVPYSNTLQGRVEGGLQYGTADIGYSWIRTPDLRVGSFAGLNILNQNMNSYGCVQLANPNGPCGNFVFPNFPTSEPNIFQHNTWGALRLGTTVDIALASRLKVNVDAAYLPFVLFHGIDHHYALGSGGTVIAATFPDWGYGRGVQLEAGLTFAVTDQLNLGAGARYWSMWTNDSLPGIFGVSSQGTNYYRTDTAGLFVQASYKFGESCCAGPAK